MRLVSIPCNPAPEGAIVGMVRTPDDISIRCARWASPADCKGTVCLFPGRTEFIEKYFEVIGELRSRGFAVATFDWRGQGLSDRLLGDPRKSHVNDFAQYGIDFDAFMDQVVRPNCPPPLFGLAHSMGAAILLHALRGRQWFDRVVVTAPMIRLADNRLLPATIAAARMMHWAGLGNSYVPGGGPAAPSTIPALPASTMPFPVNRVTSDPVRHARTAAIIDAEPALATGAPTATWLHCAARAMAEFADSSFAAKLRQPLLILACGGDRIVSTAAITDFAGRLPSGIHLVVDRAEHELLMEKDAYRAQFWAAFDGYIPGRSP